MSVQLNSNIPQINYSQTVRNQAVSYPAFRADSTRDTVEISGKKEKKKKSFGAKAGMWIAGITGGVVGTIGTICAAAVLLEKHELKTLKRLYKEKMTFVNLPQKLEFKEAKTVDEGIAFAKNVLKIKDVDKNFSLEAINFANKGLIDVANANNGRLFMPKKMYYTDSSKQYVACVQQDIKSKDFGALEINKKYFNSEYLDKELKEQLYKKDGEKKFEFEDDTWVRTITRENSVLLPDKDVRKLIKQYYNNSENLNINQKRELLNSFWKVKDNLNGELVRSPYSTLQKYKARFEKGLNIKINLDELKNKTTKEQQEYLSDIVKRMYDKDKYLTYDIKLFSPIKTIYHEMGHLQDFAKNLKELHLKTVKKESLKEFLKKSKEAKKRGEQYKGSDFVDYLDNRWSGTTYDGKMDLFKNNPEKFKEKYPDLHEFLTNEQTQQSAGKISWYAQTSIGEFIAEVYARMIQGEKIPDDVMTLYKKYNGPEIPFA